MPYTFTDAFSNATEGEFTSAQASEEIEGLHNKGLANEDKAWNENKDLVQAAKMYKLVGERVYWLKTSEAYKAWGFENLTEYLDSDSFPLSRARGNELASIIDPAKTEITCYDDLRKAKSAAQAKTRAKAKAKAEASDKTASAKASKTGGDSIHKDINAIAQALYTMNANSPEMCKQHVRHIMEALGLAETTQEQAKAA